MQQKAPDCRLIGISNERKTSPLAMSSASPIIPTYSAVALRFVEPMRHGDGRRFVTSPAVFGRTEPGVLFANLILLSGTYYLSGPAFPADGEQAMRRAVLAGKAGVAAHNNNQTGGQCIYTASSAAEALTLLWNLLAAHYGIKDAAAQVQAHELREATTRHREGEDYRAALESPAAAVPVGNTSTDWVPDYPSSADDPEGYDYDSRDDDDYREDDDPSDDEQDDDPADMEAEALGDLYNSQWD